MAQHIFKPQKKICLTHCSTVAGKKEGDGPLKDSFDLVYRSLEADGATREQDEASLVSAAFTALLKKSGLQAKDMDLILCGDLMNQCTASAFGLKESEVPYFGLYGACSTYVLSALIGSISMESGWVSRCVFGASSNFATAERQFRTPLEYGGQRPPTAQCTVSGCGMGLLQIDDSDGKVRVSSGLCGRIVDAGVTDVSNMGAAMAPAAADTLMRYLKETNTSPRDYDQIVTGDLGWEGNSLLAELLHREGVYSLNNLTDCGLKIYYREEQDVHCGGSGCACSALVHGAYYFPALQRGEIQKMLLIGTGALMSPLTVQQGLSIPAIAHLICFEREVQA